MSRQSELIKNTAILSFGKMCTQFVQFLLLPLYTALLDPAEFGIVDLFNTYVVLLVPLFNWQFERGLFRFMLDCRSNADEQKTVFSTVIIANFCQSVLFLCCYLLFRNFIDSSFRIFLAIDVVANIFMNTLLQFARGIGKNTSYAVASFLSIFCNVSLNVIFIAVLKMGALGMFLATAISKFITIAYLFVADKSWHFFSVRHFHLPQFKAIFRYSIPLVPNALSWWVISASNRSIITASLGLAANGVFAAASKFSGIFITVYNVFDMAWTESVSLHMRDPDKDEYLTGTINTVFQLFGSLCILLISVMPFVFPIMVSTQYADAYQQIPILMLAVLFQVAVGLYSAIYIALKKSDEIAKSSIMAAAINLCTNICLIRHIGLYAASLATMVGYAVMAIYRYIDCKRFVDARLSFKKTVALILVGAFAAACYYRNSLFSNILSFVVMVIFAIAVNRKLIGQILDFIKKILFRVRKV